MKHKSEMTDDAMMEEAGAALHIEASNAQQKYEMLTPEDFLERARNADRILENCRKALRGI